MGKYDFLSEEIESYLDPKNAYQNHSRNVLTCLSHTAKNSVDFYILGLALYNAKKYKKSIENFDKAIKMKLSGKTLALAYREKGRCYEALGQYKKAVFYYTKAIKIDKNCVEAYDCRGCVYDDRLNKYALAYKDFKKCIQLEPENAKNYYNLALCFQKQGKLKLAIKYYLKTIETKNDYAEAHVQSGICLQKLGNYEKAKEFYKKAISLTGDMRIFNCVIKYSLKARDKKMAFAVVKEGL